MERNFGLEYWSGVKFWSGKYSCTLHHKIQQNICQSQKRVIDSLAYQIYNGNCLSVLSKFGVECWSGVVSNFGVANVLALFIKI